MATMDGALDGALAAFRSGDLNLAEHICRQALQGDDRQADLWCLLGVVCRVSGRLDEAAAHQRRALEIRPNFLEALNNLGNVLVLQQRFGEAIPCYQRVMELKPDFPEAYSNLGAAQRGMDRLDEAMANYRHALVLRPDFADAHANLGDVLDLLGCSQEAMAHHREALRLNPNHASAMTGLGNALEKVGQVDEAIAQHRQALRLNPNHAEAHSNLGKALSAKGQYTEALASFQESLRLQPGLAVAHYNKGIALAELGRLDEALASYRRALELKPGWAAVYENIGAALVNFGRPDEAHENFARALEFAPDSPGAHMGRAITLLLRGDYAAGWPEYEWRWKTKDFTPPQFAQPMWDGSALGGRPILLRAEQGMGDTLLMIRYAPLVKARGGEVIVACQKPLLKLLSRTPGIDRLVANDVPLPDFAVHAPLLSLPGILGTTLDSIPAEVPYLAAQPDLVEEWREKLAPYRGLRIGVTWQGNPKFPSDRQRSFTLSQLAPLARLEGVHLFSLQKGAGVEQLEGVRDQFPIVDLGTTIDEAAGPLMDTAAIVANLDLVIAPDTALAHLAGGLGAPVWLALSYAADWRWLLDREDSPWYPTARLFRQDAPGDWPSVFNRMADAIAGLPPRKPRPIPIRVEIGAGELIDKITILSIKRDRMTDPARREHVLKELEALESVRTRTLDPSADLDRLAIDLRGVNDALWSIEDEIRLCERQGDFGARFIELARSVYHKNDERSALKTRINELAGSNIVEQKLYTSYQPRTNPQAE